MTRIGNDVVDLREPRTARPTVDDRFLERVCARDEAEAIHGAESPVRALWIHWAAKEAAYKVVTKLLGSPPVFEHAAFRLRLGPGSGYAADQVRGRVGYRGVDLPIRIENALDRIHAVAWHRGPSEPDNPFHQRVRLFPELCHPNRRDWKEGLRDHFSEREWKAVHGPASGLVRLRARADLARLLEVAESELEIVCEDGPPGRMPPRVLLGGEPGPTDLSLSHHGRFLAWAFTLPPEE